MAKNENKRRSPSEIQEDKDALTGLETLTNYTPSNQAYTLAKVQQALATMAAAQKAEKQAEDALKTARDNANAAEWAYHKMILGVREQAVSQYGDDSNEIQVLGLKKKSEYKRSGGRPKKNP